MESDEVATAVLRRRAKSTRVTSETVAGPRLVEQWVWALSLLHANDADQDRGVLEFRQRLLHDGLIGTEAVKAWIEERVVPGPSLALIVIDPVELASDDGTGVVDLRGGHRHVRTFISEFVDYPAEGYVGRVPVSPGSVLDELRSLSELLARSHPWQRAQATAFILTGATPVAQVLRVTKSHMIGAEYSFRVTIDADPRVPVEEVTSAYVSSRGELIGPRARLPLERGLRLVILALLNPGMRDVVLQREWNKQNPKTAFRDLRGMRQSRRDTLRAFGAVP